MLWFLVAHWLWIGAMVAFLGGYALLRLYFGQTISSIVGFLVALLIIYLIGRKNGRDNYEKIAIDIQEKREAEYEKINSRNTSAADVSDRLRNGSF